MKLKKIFALFVLALLSALAIEIVITAISAYVHFMYNLYLARMLSIHDYAIAVKQRNVWMVAFNVFMSILQLLATVGIGFLFGKKTRSK